MVKLTIRRIDVVADTAAESVSMHADAESAYLAACDGVGATFECAVNGWWVHDFDVDENDNDACIATIVRS